MSNRQICNVYRFTGVMSFATPAVSTNKFAADFDYKHQLEHYAGGGGWDRLNFGNAGINLVYLCWQLSDIASINSSQNNPEIGRAHV